MIEMTEQLESRQFSRQVDPETACICLSNLATLIKGVIQKQNIAYT